MVQDTLYFLPYFGKKITQHFSKRLKSIEIESPFHFKERRFILHLTHFTLSLDRAAMEVRFPPRPVLNCLLGSLRWGGTRPKNTTLKNILQQEMGEKKQKTRSNPPSSGHLGLVILRKIRFFFFRVSKRLWLFLLTFCVDEDKCCDGDAGVVPMASLTTLESCCISASFLCKAVFKVGIRPKKT